MPEEHVNLDTFFRDRIAKMWGVHPEEVTDDLLRQKQRELRRSGKLRRLDDPGRPSRHLRHLDEADLERLIEENDKFFAELEQEESLQPKGLHLVHKFFRCLKMILTA